MSREAAFTGLFGLLQAMQGAPFRTISRRLQLLEDLNATQLPAVFLQLGTQSVVAKPPTPAKRTLRANLFLYVAAPDDKAPSGPLLNHLIDQVEAALAPSPLTLVQTLGGVVQHAWIEGTIETFEAIKTQRAAALVPITILLP